MNRGITFFDFQSNPMFSQPFCRSICPVHLVAQDDRFSACSQRFKSATGYLNLALFAVVALLSIRRRSWRISKSESIIMRGFGEY